MPWPLLPVSTSSSSTSSSPGSPQTIVLVVTGFAVILATYKIFNSFVFTQESAQSDSLHRSNAIRRRHRSQTNTADSSNDNLNLQLNEWGENESIRLLMLDGEQISDETENIVLQDEVSVNMSQALERNGQNIVTLLFRVSEDASKRNAYVHKGCACNCCGMVPIRGIRYRCANCADYDLCESCEAQGVHIKTHIFYKIRVPTSATGPRTLQPVWYMGDPDSVTRQLPKETLVQLSRETGFEKPELDAYWEQWTFMANTDWREDPHDIHLAMDRKTFERCLVPSRHHASPCLIVDRMFAFYDTNQDDLIGFAEFLHGITYRKKKDKWKKIFEGYDVDGDGYVDRKDFLRIFRSYYVLYRTMHADILEGTVEQRMTSADAYRLVSSRQPLSSVFGQDGRFPRAPDPRTGEGKAMLSSGDLEIIDGKGVINESSLDHGDRHEVFKRRLPKQRWGDDRPHDRGYWEILLNPPNSPGQLTSMLRNFQQTGDSNSSNSHPALSASIRRQIQTNDDEHENTCSEDAGSEADNVKWPPDHIQVTDEDAQAIDGPGAQVLTVRYSSRRQVLAHALLRLRNQQKIYDRWQRRHFYTDEEEGGNPPDNWKESDDLLQNVSAGENSQPSCALSYSRSSSKVRGAKKSNKLGKGSCPSTSAKCIYDCWEVLEISDAERDAGKEILFQVTQQAFNELLDPLFKRKEDIAMEAAATLIERKKLHDVISAPEFEEWAIRRHELERNQQRVKDLKTSATKENIKIPVLDETNCDRELEKLLEAAGFTISEERVIQISSPRSSATPVAANPATRNSLSELRTNSPELPSLDVNFPNSSPWASPSPRELWETCEHVEDPRDRENLNESETRHLSIVRDPTMPQFLPNRLPLPSLASYRDYLMSSINHKNDAYSPKHKVALESLQDSGSKLGSPEPSQDRLGSKKDSSRLNQPKDKLIKVSKATLYRYWLCNMAEEEAKYRGGWGKISLEEFEELVKGEVDRETSEKDSRESGLATRMDYLGSWIEFCIS
ncbi:hypothetical protein K3495_g3790 [Podosphaera aphanis]|nr:hypothetical protein K3495_g3790 [Podosphaera aphanis]